MKVDKEAGWHTVQLMACEIETINHILKDGMVADGNLISKTVRDNLVLKGLVVRADGHNMLTVKGQKLAEVIRGYFCK